MEKIDWQQVIDKVLSGRLWLTIIAGAVFAYAVVNKIINAEATTAIVTAVFMAYFQRTDRNNKGGHV